MTTDVEDCWLLLNDLAQRLECCSFTLNIKLLFGIMRAQKEAQMLKLFLSIQWLTKRFCDAFYLPHEWVGIEKCHVKGFFPNEVLLYK
jgi:hypothetical protein